MAIRIKIPRGKNLLGSVTHPAVKFGVAAFLIACIAFFGAFAYYYVRYQKIIDKRLSGPIFSNSAKIYGAPATVKLGEPLKLGTVAGELHRAGYSEKGEVDSRMGTFKLTGSSIEVDPGPQSYHTPEAAIIHVTDGKVDTITQPNGNQLEAYELEPQLITGLFDRENRVKRRLITYDEMPKVLVDAILSIEDKRFFQHGAVNYYRMLEAAINNLHSRHKQGGSTLTMQLARGFFLTPQQTYKRKAEEMLIATELEQRLSKQQIFELYVNQVPMGMRGSFSIRGFGEGAQAYFGKDIGSLNLQEAALLAGIVNGPTYFSPYRHPDRAKERRDIVLQAMADNGVISQTQADEAKATSLKLAPPNVEASDAPYFVDMVRESLLSQYKEGDLNENGYRIYTTLDPDLQKAAADAIDIGMKQVDDLVRKKRTRRIREGKGKSAKTITKVLPGPEAQVALVCIDPHTGAVLALSGGRNYGFSQLNHALASRPTGSIFKPFVFATAMNTAINGTQPVFTPASVVDDDPTVFQYEDKVYTPKNYEDKYYGPVSFSFALAHSLNNATVKVAEMIGYDKVVDLAHAAGIKSVRATPAMAIGSYDATPMEMAGAYTVFANGGTRVSPIFVSSLRDARGDVIQDFNTDTRQVLDPRIAFVVTTMMEGVLNYGTAAGIRAQGFTAPAAGKTGTSHDAWFAGYTSNLLCIVWVGYDDYSDLKLEGAHTAGPIWEEFMKRAIALPQYKDGVKDFTPPAGVVDVKLDKITNNIATAVCPNDYDAAFIDGTQPSQTCEMTAGDQRNFFQKLFGIGPKPPEPTAVSNPNQPVTPGQQAATASSPAGQPVPPADDQDKKKKGFFSKLFGSIKGDNSQNSPQSSSPQPAPRENPRPQ
ncbi:MAG TPA: transglycosylase domain-containing protein [Terriglobales bacterium]|nr:transglycosylase domain-containing protein [Terriglobales bacterium]